MVILDQKISEIEPFVYTNGSNGMAYDPYLWMALVPIEACTLIINLKLIWNTKRSCKKDGGTPPRLLAVMLRDNVLYLSA